MSAEKTTNELIRVALPARLVTVRRFLEALDADELDPETMVTVARGGHSLIVTTAVRPPRDAQSEAADARDELEQRHRDAQRAVDDGEHGDGGFVQPGARAPFVGREGGDREFG